MIVEVQSFCVHFGLLAVGASRLRGLCVIHYLVKVFYVISEKMRSRAEELRKRSENRKGDKRSERRKGRRETEIELLEKHQKERMLRRAMASGSQV